jgi:hypothetical protein
MELDFEIEKLTHSLENALTGKVLATDVVLFSKSDLKNSTKQNGWKFNWKAEFSATGRQVFKLVLQQQPETIQGLVSFSVQSDHVFMDLIETAPHNFGKGKQYLGVAGNLVAYGCTLAVQYGFDGFLAFDSKTKLIEHYKKGLGAQILFGQRMFIDETAAKNLINKYYPDFFNN